MLRDNNQARHLTTHLATHSHTCTLAHLHTCSLTHSYACSLAHLHTCAPTRSHTCTPTNLLAHLPARSLSCSLARVRTHSLAHSKVHAGGPQLALVVFMWQGEICRLWMKHAGFIPVPASPPPHPQFLVWPAICPLLGLSMQAHDFFYGMLQVLPVVNPSAEVG